MLQKSIEYAHPVAVDQRRLLLAGAARCNYSICVSEVLRDASEVAKLDRALMRLTITGFDPDDGIELDVTEGLEPCNAGTGCWASSARMTFD